MRKPYLKIFTLFLAVSLAACTSPAVTTTPSIPPAATMTTSASDTTDTAVVMFTDPVLEEMVRGAMGRPEGDITAAEAEAVTRLNLSIELQRYFSEERQIKEISGLENFTNLEFLDLSQHAIADISPLAGLNKLTLLSLGGNPVADLAPLAGLTSLKGLILDNCAAQEYSPLAALVHLEYLKLDNSTIMDVSPLASLASLKHLYLAGSPVDDLSLLLNIYPNLVSRDFILASTLMELGFSVDHDNHQANYDGEDASISINHIEWGAPPMESDSNCIRVSMYLEGDYKLTIGYYPVFDAYVFGMGKDGEMLLNYVYDAANDSFTFGIGDRESSELTIRTALGDVNADDVLLALIPIYKDTIKNEFSMTANALFALPSEPPTLESLGYYPDEANAVYRYEWRDGNELNDVNIEVHRPEWGEKEYDVRFFTPLTDEYRIVITYHVNDRKFMVGADDNFGGGASFEYFIDTQEYVDSWCSNQDMTVEEYYLNAYNDPAIADIYQHSVELMEQFFNNTFGMTVEDVYALPNR